MKYIVTYLVFLSSLFFAKEIVQLGDRYYIGDRIVFYIKKPSTIYDSIVAKYDASVIEDLSIKDTTDFIKINFAIFKEMHFNLEMKLLFYYRGAIVYDQDYESNEIEIITPDIEDNNKIKDIVEPKLKILPIVLIILLLGIIVIVVIMKKKGKFKTKKEKRYKSNYLKAIAKINELQSKKYTYANYKEYFQELVDIIRSYINEELSIDTFNMLSSEITKKVIEKHNNKNLEAYLNEFFQIANYIKFSNDIPSDETKTKIYILAGYILDTINKMKI